MPAEQPADYGLAKGRMRSPGGGTASSRFDKLGVQVEDLTAELAKQLGNVSQACRVMGYSRDSFYRFRDFTEAMAAVNRSRYGLQAGVFTNDLMKTLAAFDVLEAGEERRVERRGGHLADAGA